MLYTFEGTFLETIADFSQFFGLVGEALASALSAYDIKSEKKYCCSAEEAKRWKNCAWAVSRRLLCTLLLMKPHSRLVGKARERGLQL